jgi:hypothetical protein
MRRPRSLLTRGLWFAFFVSMLCAPGPSRPRDVRAAPGLADFLSWTAPAMAQTPPPATTAPPPAAPPASTTPPPAAAQPVAIAPPPAPPPTAPPAVANANPAPTLNAQDCLTAKAPESTPDGDQKLTITPDAATRWQPVGGMVRFTIEGAASDLVPGNLTIVACFRWLDGKPEGEGDGVAVPALRVLDTSAGKITLGAIVPRDMLKHRPSWWADTWRAMWHGKSGNAYDGWGIVPLAGLRIMAVNNGDWKQLDYPIEVGITLRYMALLVAFFTIVPAWLIILRLAKSRPGITGGRILSIIANQNGYASLSQFQITLWTFVLAGGVIYVMALSGALIDIPVQALTLLGISGAAVLTASLPGATASTSVAAPPASATAPGVVTRLRTIGGANSTSVVLAWQPPSAGTTAAAYIVERSANAGAAWSQVAGTTDPLLEVTGLTAGTAYQFRVTATDARGSPGPASAPLAVQTAAQALAGGAPTQPQPPAINPAVGETWVAVQWTALAPAPDGYVLQYRASAAAAWTTAPGPIDAVRYQLTRLNPGTTYDVRIAAIGNGMLGPWSTPATATTMRHVPKWSDLIIWDGNDEVDVTRIQMLVFTLIAAGFVLLKIGNESMIPDIPQGILLLMGISNGVYLTAKFIPPQR